MTQQPDQNQGEQPQQGQTPQQPQQSQEAAQAAAQQAAAQQQAAQPQQPQQPQPGYAQGGHQYAQPQQPQPGYAQGGQQHQQYHQQYAQQGSAPSAASAQGTGYAGHHGYQQGYAQPQPPQAAPQEKNFLAALFDFSFQKPTAEKYAKFFFLVVVVTIAFHWLITTVFAFVDGTQGGSYDPWPGLISLVFGPLLVLVAIILVRVFFENTIGNIRTSQKLASKED